MAVTETSAHGADAGATASAHEWITAWAGPLFIIGMPRSGTKLLRGLLHQHPRVRVPTIETEFFPFLVRWVRERGRPASDSAFSALFARLRDTPYFMHRPGDAPAFSWREWRAHCRGRHDAAGLFEGFVRYETGAGHHTHYIWGDKSPAYMRHVSALLAHFPQARVIHIVRDVRDYCLSIRRTWNKDIRRAAFCWGRDVADVHRICQAHPERCIEVRYEDLLQMPETQMRRLSEFLQIEFFAGMTRLEHSVEARGDASGRVDVVGDNLQKFAARLSKREIRAVESLAWSTMQLYGYQPMYARRQKQLSPLALRARRARDGFWLVVRAARREGVASALRFHWNHARVAD
jgi:hypothetical protein